MVKSREVLFVSKPVVAPFDDGTKCIVRDLAAATTGLEVGVLSVPGADAISDRVSMHGVYRAAGSYTPGLAENLRAFAWLATRSRACLWHFVFAPNPKTSRAAALLRALRRVPTVQTVASRPRSFDEPESILFGDVVVAQSNDTRRRILEGYERAKVPSSRRRRVEVIPPPLGPVRIPTLDDTDRVRAELAVGPDVPLLLFPGDLEAGNAARWVGDSVQHVVARHREAVVVFAYRSKSPASADVAERLKSSLSPTRTRFVCDAPDMLALLRTSAVVLFPVDDLYGKVDLPIVLLETMALGTPVIALDSGPLSDLEGVERLREGNPELLATTALALVDDYGRRTRRIEAQSRAVAERHDASRVAGAYQDIYLELLHRR